MPPRDSAWVLPGNGDRLGWTLSQQVSTHGVHMGKITLSNFVLTLALLITSPTTSDVCCKSGFTRTRKGQSRISSATFWLDHDG